MGFTTDRYTAPHFLELERQRIFHGSWLAVAREEEISRPGSCLAVDELGSALLVVRGQDARVRTFRNACRHRGTRLVTRRCTAPHIRCPYHGWTYALDGRLAAVPKAEGFSGLDPGAFGLSAIRTECWGGFVWISFDAEAPSVRHYLGPLVEELEPYRLEGMRPLLRRSWTLRCNWKAVLDQATESYHLRSVHPRLARVVDNRGLTFRPLGRHSLQTIPMPDSRWRERLDRLTIPGDLTFTAEQTRLFHKYLVFPNTLLNVMPYHLTVFRVFPLTPDTCRLHYEFHIRRGAGVVSRARGWLTLLGSLYILREDLRILPRFQSGVQAAMSYALPFHREEEAVAYFHGVLDEHLGTEDFEQDADSGGAYSGRRASS